MEERILEAVEYITISLDDIKDYQKWSQVIIKQFSNYKKHFHLFNVNFLTWE